MLAAALVLTRADLDAARALATLRLSGGAAVEGASATATDLPVDAFAPTLAHNPQVGLADLVDAVQRGRSGSLRLDRGKGRGYRAELRSKP